MTDTDRAYEALGKTRSELARCKQQNAEQQKRIRKLEGAIIRFGSGWSIEFQTGKYFCRECGMERNEGHADDCPYEYAAAILKGK